MGLCLISRRQGGRRILCCLSFVVLSLIGALGLSAPSASAQQQEIKDLASTMAQSLHASGEKKVAVFDFVGPGETITAFGAKLADDFSRALSQSDQHLHVEDRRDVAHRMKEMDYGPEDSLDAGSVLAFAQVLKLNAAVLGTIARDGDQMRVSVRAVQIGDKGTTVIDSRGATIAVSDESAKLMQTYIARPEADAGVDKSLPEPGTGGYSYPKCVYCPQPQYSQPAIHAKFQGTVMLSVVITADGRATDIRVKRRLPYGLTNKAIEAVQQWKFEPAKDSDGRPVAVRTIIETTFHLY
jgi:TonB family protein